jgi:hypothetical protein
MLFLCLTNTCQLCPEHAVKIRRWFYQGRLRQGIHLAEPSNHCAAGAAGLQMAVNARSPVGRQFAVDIGNQIVLMFHA